MRADEKKKKIALIGIKFVNVPQQTEDIISWRMAAILELENSFYLTKPDEAKIVYGRNKIFLVGELSRFDLATGELKHYEIYTAYDKFGNDLVAFKKQFVESVAIGKRNGRSPWSYVVLGGLVVATVLSLRLALGNKASESGTDPGSGGDN